MSEDAEALSGRLRLEDVRCVRVAVELTAAVPSEVNRVIFDPVEGAEFGRKGDRLYCRYPANARIINDQDDKVARAEVAHLIVFSVAPGGPIHDQAVSAYLHGPWMTLVFPYVRMAVNNALGTVGLSRLEFGALPSAESAVVTSVPSPSEQAGIANAEPRRIERTDGLDGIFEYLEPSDFIEPDMAAQQIEMPPDADFDWFVSEYISRMDFAFASCDGAINPLVVLATESNVRVHQAKDDESLGQYIERMSHEARKLPARWVFFFKKTTVALAGPNEADTHDAHGDPKKIQRAAKAGRAQEAVYWYAARADGVEPRMRHGYAVIDDQRLSQLMEGPTQENTLLDQILDY